MKAVARLLAFLMAALVCVALGIVFIDGILWPDLPHSRAFSAGGLALTLALLARLIHEERHRSRSN
jgi:hypothetical protein